MFSHLSTHASFLVELADGDQAAWHKCYDRYGELVRAVSHKSGLQANDCDDVLQEVMEALAKRLPTFKYDPARGKFRDYLKEIARNVIRRRNSCQNSGEIPLEDIGGPSAAVPKEAEFEKLWEDQWRQYHLRLAMRIVEEELNDRDLEAFRQYAVEGVDVQTVAATLGMSGEQVYQAKSRILRRLREIIREQVEAEG